MSKKTIYTVSVWNQKHNGWMSTIVHSMADCVRLTCGLLTNWEIVAGSTPNRKSPWFVSAFENGSLIVGPAPFRREYQHTLRSLASKAKMVSKEYSCDDMHMLHVVRYRRYALSLVS